MNSSSWIISFFDLYYHNGIIDSRRNFGYPLQDRAEIFYICDCSAGNGSPQFVMRDGVSYIFHWYTNLLCTNSSTECMVQDPFSHLIYDLSGLSIYESSWARVVNQDNKESKIYLSICRSLTEPLICDSSAAACMVEKVGEEEKVIVSNLGQPVSLPVLESPGHLILEYTNGNPCTKCNENITYSTVIHLLCAKDKVE
ncbi:Cation-independent mannose-6-phosphate receptor, partial [Stegodyphus mimosarum]